MSDFQYVLRTVYPYSTLTYKVLVLNNTTKLVRGSGKLRASWLRLGSNLVVGTYVGNGVGVKDFVTVVLCTSTLERELQCEFRQGGSAPLFA